MLKTIMIVLLLFIYVYSSNLVINYVKSFQTGNIMATLKGKAGWVLSVLALGIITVLGYYSIISKSYYMYIDLIIILIMMSIIDYKHHTIPNGLNLSLLLSLLDIAIIDRSEFNILYLVILAVMLILIILCSGFIENWIGMGDIKLLLIIMLFFGIAFVIYTIFFALILMILFSVPMLLTKKMTLKSQLPFVPFYTVGVLIFYAFQFL